VKNIKAKIIANELVGGRYYRLRLASPYLGGKTRPGQFFEIKCSEVPGTTLLRRPLGAHRIFKGGVEMLYEAVGKGTEALSRRMAGESLGVIGPLGNGFDVKKKAIIIAGGIGVAPLVALAETVIKKGGEAEVLIGARTGSHILCEKELKKFGCNVRISTDDGSKGKKGFVTELLEASLSSRRNKNNVIGATIYSCGPIPMLKAVAQLAAIHSISCQVSLEERMACGVGVCLGCPVKVKAPQPIVDTQYPIRNTQYEYKMVCKDGPVFDAKDVIW